MIERLNDQHADGEDLAPRGWQGPGWYFWDEAGVALYGPFPAEGDARDRQAEYARTLGSRRGDA